MKGAFNQCRCILRSVRRLAGKVAHLIRDDGEALAGYAGTRSLHGRVESKDICLECNIVDCFDNVADFL